MAFNYGLVDTAAHWHVPLTHLHATLYFSAS